MCKGDIDLFTFIYLHISKKTHKFMLILQIPIRYPGFILAFSLLFLFITPFSDSEKPGSHNPHSIYLFSQSQYTPKITSKYLTHTPVINKFTISSTRSVYNSFVMLNLQYIAKILFSKAIRLVLPIPFQYGCY